MEPRDKKPGTPPAKTIEGEVEITRFKGSGPGGQNRNKRETGIRIKHIESGVVVSATERRSQGQNLSTAFERLKTRLEERAYRPPPRRKTRPTKASGRKRLESKKKASLKKSRRGRYSGDD